MIWALVIVAAVLALAVVGVLLYRQRRSARLRVGFRDGREAEAERFERRKRYDIKPLGATARDRYAERWRAAQVKFVDQPASALADADTLVAEVMRDHGYPVEDFEHGAADVSVDRPQVVEHYRKAHAIHGKRQAGTEELREALLHYRALFAELLEPPARNERAREIR